MVWGVKTCYLNKLLYNISMLQNIFALQDFPLLTHHISFSMNMTIYFWDLSYFCLIIISDCNSLFYCCTLQIIDSFSLALIFLLIIRVGRLLLAIMYYSTLHKFTAHFVENLTCKQTLKIYKYYYDRWNIPSQINYIHLKDGWQGLI